MAGIAVALSVSVFALVTVAVMCADNNTSAVPSATLKPVKSTRPTGVLASLGKMFIDIPLGFVEAFKDGAELIESLMVTIVRGIFS